MKDDMLVQSFDSAISRPLKNGVGAWECWNVSGKEKTEIGDLDKTY
jgi:hypothetical protein